MAALVAAFVVMLASAAQAGVCLPHADMVAKLKQTHGEQKVGLGLGSRGSTMFELFLAETGSWTLLRTYTNGISCIVVFGNSWEISPLRQGDPL
jgi:hypothetical protein